MRDQLDINWEDEFNKYPDDIEKQWDLFKKKFCEAEARCVPRKIVKINGNYSKKFSIPLSQKNLRKLKKKNNIWSKMRKKLAFEEEKLTYRNLKNQIRRLTRQGKNIGEEYCETNKK